MSEFVVHGIPGSPFMRSVALAMEEKSAPYSIRALGPGESRSEAYRALHPFGRMPVIEHDGYRLYETQAILRYIDAAFPDPALQPADAKAIGRMNQVIGINDWYLFPQAGRIIAFQRIIGPGLLGLKPDEAACAAAVPDAERSIGALNTLLGANAFLAGDKLTLADLMIAPQLDYLAITPEGAAILEGTKLSSWLARMNARASMARTLPPEAFRKAA